MRHAMVHHHAVDFAFCCSSWSDGLELPICYPSWQIWICHNLLTKSILWAEFLLWQGCGLFLRVSSTILAMVDCRHCWYLLIRVSPGLARSISLRPAFDFEYVLFMERGARSPKCAIYGLRPSYTWFGLPEPHTRTTRLPMIQTREHGKGWTPTCSHGHCASKSRAHTIPFFIISGAQNDFVNVVAKSWKIKRNNRRQSKSDTICAGNRRKEARFEKKAESTKKMK